MAKAFSSSAGQLYSKGRGPAGTPGGKSWGARAGSDATQKMRSAMSTLLLCSEIVLVCSKLTIHSFLGRQSHTVPNQSPVSDSISPGIAAFIGGSVRCRGFARKLPSNGFSQLSQERIIQFFPSKERRTARFYVPCRQRKSMSSVRIDPELCFTELSRCNSFKRKTGSSHTLRMQEEMQEEVSCCLFVALMCYSLIHNTSQKCYDISWTLLSRMWRSCFGKRRQLR